MESLKSQLIREFSGNDEASIDFSVDPDMLTKLQIKKAKKGEENTYDLQKMYYFQLNKDIEKIRKVKGLYPDKIKRYHQLRLDDPFYREISTPLTTAKNGAFTELLQHTIQESWQNTSQPYGEIAHKRYLEYIANLPKGPTNIEVKDKIQRSMDRDTWENTLLGRYEPTRRELLEMKAKREKDKGHNTETGEIDADTLAKEMIPLAKRKMLEALKEENFELARIKPTQSEFKDSMRNWRKGVYFPYNITKGFPYVMRNPKTVREDVIEVVDILRPVKEQPKSSKIVMEEGGAILGQEKEYAKFLGNRNLKLAERHLKVQRSLVEKEKKKKEKEKLEEARVRRRVATVGFDIAENVVKAKIETAKDALAFTVQLETEGEKSKKLRKTRKNTDQTLGDAYNGGDIQDEDNASSSSSASGTDSDSDAEKHSTTSSSSATASRPRQDGKKAINQLEGTPLTLPIEQQQQPQQSRPRSAVPSVPTLSTRTMRLSRPKSASVVPVSPLRVQSPSAADRIAPASPLAVSKSTMGATTHSFSDVFEDLDIAKSLRHFARRVRKVFTRKKSRSEKGAPYKSATEIKKEEAIQQLKSVEEELSKDETANKLVVKSEYDLTIDEFRAHVKKRRARLRKELEEVDVHHPTKDEVHRKELLMVRIRKLEEMIAEREEREEAARAILAKAQEYLNEQEASIQAVEETRAEKLERWVRDHLSWKKKEKPRMQINKFLPPIPNSKEKYEDEVNELLKQRIVERQQQKKEDKRWALLTGIPYDEDKQLTAEDLFFGAQSGDYKLVLDTLDFREDVFNPDDEPKPFVKNVNCLNSDGVNAVYAALSMVLRRTALGNDDDLDDWKLSSFQRFMRRVFGNRVYGFTQPHFDKVIMVLLRHGADLSIPRKEPGRDGLTILHEAAAAGNVEMLEWLLLQGLDVHQLSTSERRTPLMLAVERDHLDATMVLMKFGAVTSVNYPDRHGNTVLHIAAKNAQPLLAEVLLICGAKPNLRNKAGRLPSEEAKAAGRVEMVRSIMAHSSMDSDHNLRMQFLETAFPDAVVVSTESNGKGKKMERMKTLSTLARRPLSAPVDRSRLEKLLEPSTKERQQGSPSGAYSTAVSSQQQSEQLTQQQSSETRDNESQIPLQNPDRGSAAADAVAAAAAGNPLGSSQRRVSTYQRS